MMPVGVDQIYAHGSLQVSRFSASGAETHLVVLCRRDGAYIADPADAERLADVLLTWARAERESRGDAGAERGG